MWDEAIRVAAVGFSVVIGGLVMLAVGVKIMSFLCRSVDRAKKKH